MEAHARAEAESKSRGVVLHQDLGSEPGNDPGAVSGPGQRLEDLAMDLGVFRGGGERRIEVANDLRDRHVHDASDGRPLGSRPNHRGFDLAQLGVVDMGIGALELQAPHRRARDPIVNVVKQRQQDRRFLQEVFKLPVEALADVRADLGTRLFEEAIGLGRREVTAQEAGL